MKTLLDLGLSEEEKNNLLRGIFEGKYNLLLGAGASYGCRGGDGVELKDGASTAKEIAKDFKLEMNDSEASNLALAYEEAESTDKPLLNKWLKDRFTNCTSTWQSGLFKFDWDRIWTFNIDDVLEHAFNENLASNKFDSFHSYDWKEKIVPREQTINSQQIVYLHGRAQILILVKKGWCFQSVNTPTRLSLLNNGMLVSKLITLRSHLLFVALH